MGVSVRNSKNNGLRTGALFFSSPRLALVSREISRSPRLAHKAPVMQAMDKIAMNTLQYVKFKKTEPVEISYRG